MAKPERPLGSLNKIKKRKVEPTSVCLDAIATSYELAHPEEVISIKALQNYQSHLAIRWNKIRSKMFGLASPIKDATFCS